MNKYQEERPWGNFQRFTENESSTVKIITVNPNASLSLQKHAKRREFWKIVAGYGVVQIGDVRHEAKIDDEFEIAQGEMHRVSAGDGGIQFLEIATGQFDENDIERLEDQYGRV